MKNIIDLHTHTLFSNHAYSSLSENFDFAISYGLKVFGSSDHQPDSRNCGAKRDNFGNTAAIPKELQGMKILKGIELNCGEHFKDTMKNLDILKKLDYAIASLHFYDLKPEKNPGDKYTEYYLEALQYDLVKIVGHIDDGRYPCDYQKVIEETHLKHKLIEINNSSLNGLGYRTNSKENCAKAIDICKKLACPIILNSDAHIKYDIGNVDLAYKACKDRDFPDELIVNTNPKLIKEYFNIEI